MLHSRIFAEDYVSICKTVESMISLPLPSETEFLINRLSEKEKKVLALMIQAFVAKPKRDIAHVMDEMTAYARRQGLTPEKLDDILEHE